MMVGQCSFRVSHDAWTSFTSGSHPKRESSRRSADTGNFVPGSPLDLGLLARAGERIGVVKRSAVGTGPLRRSPAVHSQPIDLVVFQEPSHVNVPETSS